jgi:DME family drug/metabolite transporter
MQPQQQTMTARAGLLMVMTAAFFWGTGNVVARTIYDVAATNAISVATWRMALAVPALLLIGTLTLGRRLWSIHRQDLPFMLSAGALVALYQVSFYAALPRAGVAIATVVALCSAPVVVAVLSAIVLRERPTSKTISALMAAVIGTGLLINVENSAQRPDILGGVLLALLAGTLYAINTLVGRKLGSGHRVHPLQTVTIGFGFGALILVLIALPMGLTWSYPATGWLRLAYLGVIPTAVGYGLFFAGMRTVTATAASVATLLEPLTSTVIAVVLLHEPLSPQALVGSVLLILAMVILLVRRR